MDRLRELPVYLVHGTLDWMFPVEMAQVAAEELRHACRDLVWRELPDLSHTYPEEENGRILEWMDPGMALPEVESCATSTGRVDLILSVVAEDTERLDAMLDKIGNIPGVRGTESLIQLASKWDKRI